MKSLPSHTKKTLFLLVVLTAAQAAENRNAPFVSGSDDRYKADILLIVAHEDDDTAFSGYLARAVFDQHRRVAAVFITRGDAGVSAMSINRGNALGAEREIEARQALASFGIVNVWFLQAPNGNGNVLNALEYWDHGSILGQVVRLIRLTRPNVILSMWPGFSAGENHPDHQAAGVVATEAFDVAGNSAAFPEQLGIGRSDDPGGHSPEGLRAWQPKKIYFWSDSFDSGSAQWVDPPPPSPFRKNFLQGTGPAYSNTEVSPSRGVPYARLAAEEASFYLSQDGAVAKYVLANGNLKDFEPSERFILGKSLVGGTVTGDVFDGVVPGAIPFARVHGMQPRIREGLSMEFGGSWTFYQEFWAEHDMPQLAQLLPIPEAGLRMGQRLEIPIVLHNDTSDIAEVNVTAVLPEGWTDLTKYSVYSVKADYIYPVEIALMAPPVGDPRWQEITWNANAKGQPIGSLTLRVCLRAPHPPIKR